MKTSQMETKIQDGNSGLGKVMCIGKEIHGKKLMRKELWEDR
jgi:hypothetical protein